MRQTSLLRLLSLPIAFLFTVSATPTVAQEARMQYPLAVVADGQGVIYVADLELPGIWKIVDGKAEIFFQASKRFRTPLNRVRCLAIDHNGHLLAGDSATREIYRFSEDGKPEPLTDGYLGIPVVLAVAKDGTIFASDLESERIWSIPKEGLKKGEEPKEIAIIAGVRGLAFNEESELFAVTTLEDPIRKVGENGEVEVLVAGRPFQFPHHLVIKPDGMMYVTDNYAATVWEIAPGDPKPKPFVQGPPLNKPVGLCQQGENLLVADPHAKAIFSVTPQKAISPTYEAK